MLEDEVNRWVREEFMEEVVEWGGCCFAEKRRLIDRGRRRA